MASQLGELQIEEMEGNRLRGWFKSENDGNVYGPSKHFGATFLEEAWEQSGKPDGRLAELLEAASSPAGGGIDDGRDLRDSVRRNVDAPGVLENDLLAVGDILAIDLVASHEASDPLNLRPQFSQDDVGLLGRFPQFVRVRGSSRARRSRHRSALRGDAAPEGPRFPGQRRGLARPARVLPALHPTAHRPVRASHRLERRAFGSDAGRLASNRKRARNGHTARGPASRHEPRDHQAASPPSACTNLDRHPQRGVLDRGKRRRRSGGDRRDGNDLGRSTEWSAYELSRSKRCARAEVLAA